VSNLIKWLDQGKWERPSDKMAVYTEIKPGETWGIRVTLLGVSARVEAINGPKCTWYKPDRRLSADVKPASLWERLRGITFEDKLRREVEAKRAVAATENGKPVIFTPEDGEAAQKTKTP
jgi:hypothetical protein